MKKLGNKVYCLDIEDMEVPKEIDIFIPTLNIGIEFNGLYWHSELKKDTERVSKFIWGSTMDAERELKDLAKPSSFIVILPIISSSVM